MVAVLGGGELPTFRRSDAEGASESTPDHILVSAAILGAGAVKGAAVWYGAGLESTDHFPLVMDLDLGVLLNLDVDETAELPVKQRVERLRLDDEVRIGKYQQVLVELSSDRRLLERMDVIEAESNRVAQWQAERRSRYGTQDEGSALQELLDVWFRDMAEVGSRRGHPLQAV